MAQKFRECFRVASKDALHWFPGHMGKGLKQVQQKLKSVDCIIEVHDARIPMSGRNPLFCASLGSVKPYILVLNKRDLAGRRTEAAVHQHIQQQGVQHVLFTNCHDQKCRGVKQIIPLATELIMSSNRYHRSEEYEFHLMVLGVPNVGKSSLINRMRNQRMNKKSVAPVGAVAGITRSVQNRIRVSEKPPVFLLDTPGILTPNVRDAEAGLRLALCACLQDHLVGPITIADYLLYVLNKYKHFKYVDVMNLEEPTDCITTLLTKSAITMNKTQKVRNYDKQSLIVPDLEAVSHFFIKAFRSGLLGHFMLDEDLLECQ